MIDLTGRRFGRLTVERFDHLGPQWVAFWSCKCDCGQARVVRGGALKSGNTQSCGCLKIEQATARAKAIVHTWRIHGHAKRGDRSPTHVSWKSMLARCESPKATSYAYYGGRGIRVCERWHDFGAFLADMGERPAGMTLDRINPDGDYTRDNCRWATRAQQSANRRHR